MAGPIRWTAFRDRWRSPVRGRRLNLALQGGGAHGAFTWGVLDRLLAEPDLALDGVSGASAGAVNAVLLAAGLAEGGRELAAEKLRGFWQGLSIDLHDGWSGALSGTALMLSRVLGPHQLNPLDINPLRDLLARSVDFQRLRQGPVRLFIATTELETGLPRLFRREDITIEAVLASAALPEFHHPVEIDGRHYWDGGFTANPPLWPLIAECAAETLLIELVSAAQPRVPRTAAEICDRLSALVFATPLVLEQQAIARQQALAGRFWTPGRLNRRLRRHRLMRIEASAWLHGEPAASRMVPARATVERLFQAGRTAAAAHLDPPVTTIADGAALAG